MGSNCSEQRTDLLRPKSSGGLGVLEDRQTGFQPTREWPYSKRAAQRGEAGNPPESGLVVTTASLSIH